MYFFFFLCCINIRYCSPGLKHECAHPHPPHGDAIPVNTPRAFSGRFFVFFFLGLFCGFFFFLSPRRHCCTPSLANVYVYKSCFTSVALEKKKQKKKKMYVQITIRPRSVCITRKRTRTHDACSRVRAAFYRYGSEPKTVKRTP